MKKQILKILTGVVVLITLISSLSLNAFAADSFSINGTGSGTSGGSSNTNATGTGYSVQTTATYSGYRFTYMDYYGNWKGCVDIINGSVWSDYSNRKTSTDKWNKKELVDKYKSGANFSIGLTATSSTTGVKDSGAYGLSYTVKTASKDMTAWKNNAANVEKVLQAIDKNYTIDKMTSSDQILVEPIIFCSIGGVKYALTLTEIWLVAGSQFGYSTCAKWGGAAGTYDNLGYRLNGTYPDNFYVNEKNVICDVATSLNIPSSANAKAGPSFTKLITQGYGLHLIYKGENIVAPTYTLTVNPNGGSWVYNSTEYTSNKTFNLKAKDTLTINNPTRPGFTFKGWTISNSACTLSGTKYTQGIGNCTLTAQWENNSYYIKWNPNDGERRTNRFTINDQIWLPNKPNTAGVTVSQDDVSGVVTFDGTQSKNFDLGMHPTGDLAAGQTYTITLTYKGGSYKTQTSNTGNSAGCFVMTIKDGIWKTDVDQFATAGFPTKDNPVVTKSITISKESVEQGNSLYFWVWKDKGYIFDDYQFTCKVESSSSSEYTPDTRTIIKGTKVGDLPTISRDGYIFDGWYTAATGGTKISSSWIPKSSAVYYAHWIPEEAGSIDIDYDGNGATEGENWTESVDLSDKDNYILSSKTDAFTRIEENEETGSKTLFKFMGWTIDDTFYDFGAEVPVDVLNNAATSVDGRDNKVVTVYATWDEYPVINAVDRWFSLDDAQKGKITLEELMKTASAVDGEVGDVTDFEAGEGSFTIIDYDVEEPGKFTTTGSVTITYQAIDKVGNETYRTVTVHIVDKDQQVGDNVTRYTRFISKKYFKDNEGAYLAESQGGFNLYSVWINNPEYEALLTNVLNNSQNEETGEWNTIYQTFVFSIEEIAEVKEYIETHGLGNSKETDALKNFYDKYK